jgi:hypothetical protein
LVFKKALLTVSRNISRESITLFNAIVVTSYSLDLIERAVFSLCKLTGSWKCPASGNPILYARESTMLNGLVLKRKVALRRTNKLLGSRSGWKYGESCFPALTNQILHVSLCEL